MPGLECMGEDVHLWHSIWPYDIYENMMLFVLIKINISMTSVIVAPQG